MLPSLLRRFSTKLTYLPNSLKYKNPERNRHLMIPESSTFKLLKNEKLAGSKNEIFNSELKETHNKNIILYSKKMTTNYFSLYNSSSAEILQNLNDFCNKALNLKEQNQLIYEIDYCKNSLSEGDAQLNQAVFKKFLNSITNLSGVKGKHV